MKHTLAIVEDNHEIRTGLMMIINSTGDLECNHIFSNAEDAIKLLPHNCADVVLMDIDLPVMNGIEAIRILKKTCPQSQFMIISVFEDDEKIYKSLEAGANGYLLKKTVAAELVSAIHDIMNGGSPMNAQIARRVVSNFRENKTIKTNESFNDLSKREQELLELLSKGFRYKEIAELLFISQDTVRTHIRNIYQKLQVNSKIEAINKVFK